MQLDPGHSGAGALGVVAVGEQGVDGRVHAALVLRQGSEASSLSTANFFGKRVRPTKFTGRQPTSFVKPMAESCVSCDANRAL